MNILFTNCNPDIAQDKSLPYTAYLVEYDDGDGVRYDVVVSSKKSEIFDYYWDRYRNIISITQSEGRVNPKLWDNPNKKKSK